MRRRAAAGARHAGGRPSEDLHGISPRQGQAGQPCGEVEVGDGGRGSGQQAAGCEEAEAVEDLPETRQDPEHLGGGPLQDDRQQASRHHTGDESLDGQPGDLVGPGRGRVPGVVPHLAPHRHGAEDRRPDLERQVDCQVLRRVGDPDRLASRRPQRRKPREGHRHRVVPAEEFRPRQPGVGSRKSASTHHEVPRRLAALERDGGPTSSEGPRRQGRPLHFASSKSRSARVKRGRGAGGPRPKGTRSQAPRRGSGRTDDGASRSISNVRRGCVSVRIAGAPRASVMAGRPAASRRPDLPWSGRSPRWDSLTS